MSGESSATQREALGIRQRTLTVIGVVFGLIVIMDAGMAQSRSPSPTPPPLRIDPNTAPRGVLEALPRIGPALAGRILEVRREGRFRCEGDLDDRVRGIGPATIKAIRPYLRFPDDAKLAIETSPRAND